MGRICVIDYGVGNIHSALKGLRRFASDVVLTEDSSEVASASALVLPGQGSFPAGMEGLNVRGLLHAVKDAAARGKPILGICLGAQLLLDRGFEFGECSGLGIIPGDVVHFPNLAPGTKVPHMGWNAIEPAQASWDGTALENVPSGSEMYFIHSYILQPKQSDHVLATTLYGGHRFASVIGSGVVFGCQFHPEKSGQCGLRIIKSFCDLL